MGRGDHGLLLRRQLVEEARRRVGAHDPLGHDAGVVAQDDGAALMLRRPRQGAVHEALDEEDAVAGAGRDLREAVLVGLVETDVVGAGEVGPVAAGHAGEAAVAGLHVGELHGDVGHAAEHAAVAVVVAPGAVVGLAPLVEPEALGAFVHGDDAQPLEAEPGAQQLLEEAPAVGVGDHLAEDVAVGLLPGEHAAEVAAALSALEGPRAVGQVARTDPDVAGMAVHGGVRRPHLLGRQQPLDDQVPVHVEEVLLRFRHSPSGHRCSPFARGALS